MDRPAVEKVGDAVLSKKSDLSHWRRVIFIAHRANAGAKPIILGEHGLSLATSAATIRRFHTSLVVWCLKHRLLSISLQRCSMNDKHHRVADVLTNARRTTIAARRSRRK